MQSIYAQNIVVDTVAENVYVIGDSKFFVAENIYTDKNIAIEKAKENKRKSLNSTPSVKNIKGYRLMIINSNDRDLVMKIRSQLLQKYPDQKPYIYFLNPFIKFKLGNFTSRTDAEKIKKEITNLNIVPNNIYVLPDIIEVKVDPKKADSDSED